MIEDLVRYGVGGVPTGADNHSSWLRGPAVEPQLRFPERIADCLLSENVLRFSDGGILGMDSVQALIMARIKRSLDGLGAVVTPKDFLDLGGRAAVDQALGRLVRAGVLARIGRGLYHLPRVNPKLGIDVPPDPDAVAAAIGRQSGSPVAPSGAVVANRLGLSTQIAAKPVYVTTGRSRTVRVGNQTLRFKRVSPRRFPSADPAVTDALQALHGAGPDPDDALINAVRTMLTPRQRRNLVKYAKYDAAWVADSARRVVEDELGLATHG